MRKRQFRVLYREFLFRMVDIEALSSHAQGDANRLLGFAPNAFQFRAQGSTCIQSLAQLTPGRYITSPGLWFGLICAAAFIAGALRLRRYRGPL